MNNIKNHLTHNRINSTYKIIKITNTNNKYHLTLKLDDFLVKTIYESDHNEIRSILYTSEKIFKVLIHTINNKTITTLNLKYPQINLSTQGHIDTFSNDIYLLKTLTDNIQTKYIPFIINTCNIIKTCKGVRREN